MSGVPYHAWTHMPKEQGGTDPIPGSGVLPTFRASITDNWTDMSTERRGYYTGVGTDTVFWDYWDTGFDDTVFAPILQPGGQPDAGRLAAVDLLKNGLYAIRATIDWSTDDEAPAGLAGAFNTWIGSNYDDGGVAHTYMDLTSDIIGTWCMDQFRILWTNYTGAESTVEITAYHDNAAEEPLYIPGGFTGYWGQTPHLTIVYFGPAGDPAYDLPPP